MICPPQSWLPIDGNLVETSQMEDYLGIICDPHHPLLDKAASGFKYSWSFFFMGVGGTVVGVVGLIVNLLGLFQMRSYGRRISEKVVYIIALVIWDCVLLVTSWVAVCLPALLWKNYGIINTKALAMQLTEALMHVGVTGVAWMTLVTTVERYVTFRHGNLAQKITFPRSISIALATAVVAIAFNSSRFFEVELEECCDFGQAKVITQGRRADFTIPGEPYYLWYRIFAKGVFVTIIPFVIISVLTLKIVLKAELCHRNTTDDKVQYKPNDPEAKASIENTPTPKQSGFRIQRQLTRTFAMVWMKFLICYSIAVVKDIIEFWLFDEKHATLAQDTQYFHYIVDVAYFLAMIHSASSGALFLLAIRRSGAGVEPKEAEPRKAEPKEAEPEKEVLQNNFHT